MTEQTERVELVTPWWVWAVFAVVAIGLIVLLWRYLLLALIFIGLFPIARIFFGGASFWARH